MSYSLHNERISTTLSFKKAFNPLSSQVSQIKWVGFIKMIVTFEFYSSNLSKKT